MQLTNPVNIETQGIKYAGSKLKIIPHVIKLARDDGAQNKEFLFLLEK